MYATKENQQLVEIGCSMLGARSDVPSDGSLDTAALAVVSPSGQRCPPAACPGALEQAASLAAMHGDLVSVAFHKGCHEVLQV
eukprot:6188749-Pleurochrysis_carterae.AAC.1